MACCFYSDNNRCMGVLALRERERERERESARERERRNTPVIIMHFSSVNSNPINAVYCDTVNPCDE